MTDTGQDPPQEKLGALMALYQQGQLPRAAEEAKALAAAYPRSSLVWNVYAAANWGMGRAAGAEEGFTRARDLSPTDPDAHNNLGNVQKAMGNLDAAITSYRTALSLNSANPNTHYNIGNALRAAGDLAGAIAAYEAALGLKSDLDVAHNNLGSAYQEKGEFERAIAAFQKAIALKPDYAEAYANLGAVFEQLKRTDDAISALQSAVKLRPNDVASLYLLGTQLEAKGKLEEAQAAYQKVIALEPRFANAHHNLGVVFQVQGKLEDAAKAYQTAISHQRNFVEAHYNLGLVLQELGKPVSAIASYKRALALKPDLSQAESRMLHQQRRICDWTDYSKLAAQCARLGTGGGIVSPFAMLAMEDDPERQMQRSKAYTASKYTTSPLPLPPKPAIRPEKLRIGYFGADFHNHATMFLMAGLFREHDRSKFEINVYSYGQDRTGEWREAARQSVDRFEDVTDLTDEELATLAREHKLDIAIDLKGHTQRTRSGVFAYRLAPLQINYLGYPGTMGAPFIDYIVADPTIIPDAERPYYTESVIYLPHTYQPNDNQRRIAERHITRKDCGLPGDAFVFCCFNNSYKISPREFDVWMRVLGKVEGSVLWLFRSNEVTEKNLRNEARRRGIDPHRLVFASEAPHDAHLARHVHADLFIDTFDCNAHTTASDALWAGLPVVTKAGRQLAARVAASLLHAIGLPELVTETETDYEALILDLATDPEKLTAIKTKLAANRMTEPLFDTARYTRNFERGLERAYDRYVEGLAPGDIRVSED